MSVKKQVQCPQLFILEFSIHTEQEREREKLGTFVNGLKTKSKFCPDWSTTQPMKEVHSAAPFMKRQHGGEDEGGGGKGACACLAEWWFLSVFQHPFYHTI